VTVARRTAPPKAGASRAKPRPDVEQSGTLGAALKGSELDRQATQGDRGWPRATQPRGHTTQESSRYGARLKANSDPPSAGPSKRKVATFESGPGLETSSALLAFRQSRRGGLDRALTDGGGRVRPRSGRRRRGRTAALRAGRCPAGALTGLPMGLASVAGDNPSVAGDNPSVTAIEA
jgi:hypothetical protein